MAKNRTADFRHEITIISQIDTVGSNGNPVRTDDISFVKRAKVQELSGDESLIGDQIKATGDLAIECYYDARITTRCVVVYRGSRYGIFSVTDKDGMKQFVLLGARL